MIVSCSLLITSNVLKRRALVAIALIGLRASALTGYNKNLASATIPSKEHNRTGLPKTLHNAHASVVYRCV